MTQQSLKYALAIFGIINAHDVNCMGRVAKEVARFAAEEIASEVVHETWENNKESIEKAVDHVKSEWDKVDKEASDRIQHSVDKGDYFQAACDYEGSGRDAGDGCIIM